MPTPTFAAPSAAPTLDDLVFEHRPQEYGAYALRRGYAARLTLALLLAVSAAFVGASLPRLLAHLRPEVAPAAKPKEPRVIAPPPILEKPIIQPVLPPPASAAKAKTVIYLPPQPTTDPAADDPVPTTEDLRQHQTSNVASDGPDLPTDETVTGPVTTTVGPAVGEPALDPNTEYVVVEQMPEFPGGVSALMAFLGKQVHYPSLAARMGVEGTVYVSFLIGEDGRVSDVRVVRGVSKELDEEAIRVAQRMPDWKPGRQNGRTVRVRYSLPMRFRLD